MKLNLIEKDALVTLISNEIESNKDYIDDVKCWKEKRFWKNEVIFLQELKKKLE